MAASHQPNIKTARRSTERPRSVQKPEQMDVRTTTEIPSIREHLASEPTKSTPNVEATNSTTLLHTMFHLLDSIEMWLEVAAQQNPGFDGGRHRGDPRATLPAPMTLQVPPTHARGATLSPVSPNRTVFSPTASSIQGNRPRPSEYERSLIDLRRSFGLAASRSDLVEDGMPRSVLGISRQHTPTLPRVNEDADQQLNITPKARRRKTMGAIPDLRPEPDENKPHANPKPVHAQSPVVVKVPAKPSRSRRESEPVRSRPKRKKDVSIKTSPSRATKEKISRRPPSTHGSEHSGRSEYADLISLVVHNWRQSLLLKFESAKERYRVRGEIPPVVHPEAERERRRLAEKPLPSLPSSPESSGSESKRKTRPLRPRPRSAYV